MDRLEFDNYEEFACEIVSKFDSIEDEFGDVSIIARYDEAKEIIRELLCLGYDVASIDIHREEFEDYYDEYRIALNQDGIWCEKFKHKNGYLDDVSYICFVMDNCCSTVFKHINSEEIYEVSVGEGEVDEDNIEDSDNKETERVYKVNGKSVNKETFDKYVSHFAPDLVDDVKNTPKNNDYSVSVKCNLDASEALEIIADMERRIMHMNDMFQEMDCFRRLFNW